MGHPGNPLALEAVPGAGGRQSLSEEGSTMKMKRTMQFAVLAAFVAASLTVGASQEPASPAPPPATLKPADLGLIVYPAQAQDAAKQGLDESECYAWARQQTNIDPTAPVAPVQAAEAPKGGAVKGAARGAARGAVVGAMGEDEYVRDEGTLDAGEGAAAGAAAGAVKGRRAQKKAEKKAEKQAQQATATQQATVKDTFKKAWGVCLEGRGYSVK